MTAKVQTVDEDLYVVQNWDTMLYEVHDAKAPGGPNNSMVMRVQEEDGSYRPVDERTLQHLREMRYDLVNRGVNGTLRKLAEIDEQRKKDWKKQVSEVGYAVGDALKYLGKEITPTIENVKRTDPIDKREDRRAAAHLLEQ